MKTLIMAMAMALALAGCAWGEWGPPVVIPSNERVSNNETNIAANAAAIANNETNIAANAAAIASQQSQLSQLSQSVAAHVSDTNNPHGVTAEQVGALRIDATGTATARAYRTTEGQPPYMTLSTLLDGNGLEILSTFYHVTNSLVRIGRTSISFSGDEINPFGMDESGLQYAGMRYEYPTRSGRLALSNDVADVEVRLGVLAEAVSGKLDQENPTAYGGVTVASRGDTDEPHIEIRNNPNAIYSSPHLTIYNSDGRHQVRLSADDDPYQHVAPGTWDVVLPAKSGTVLVSDNPDVTNRLVQAVGVVSSDVIETNSAPLLAAAPRRGLLAAAPPQGVTTQRLDTARAIVDYSTNAAVRTSRLAISALGDELRAEIAAHSPGDYAAVSNAAMWASNTVAGIKIDHTDTTFSNEVLAVGLGIDTNAVAQLNEIAASFGDFPLGPGETATTVGGLLAALAAAVAWLRKNKQSQLVVSHPDGTTTAIGSEVDLEPTEGSDAIVASGGVLLAIRRMSMIYDPETDEYYQMVEK